MWVAHQVVAVADCVCCQEGLAAGCLRVGGKVFADAVDWSVQVALRVGGDGVTVAEWVGVDLSGT